MPGAEGGFCWCRLFHGGYAMAGVAGESRSTPAGGSSSSIPDEPAVAAIESLGDELLAWLSSQDGRTDSDLLMLHVRLRSSADALITCEPPERRAALRLGTRLFLELVESLTAADPECRVLSPRCNLSDVSKRSRRYLSLVSSSTSRIAAQHTQLIALLQSRGGIRLGGGGYAYIDRGGIGGSDRGGIGGSDSGGTHDRRHHRVIDPANYHENYVVLAHGASACVIALLLAASRELHFTLVVAEGRPDGEGHATARALMEQGVPVRMLEPCAVAGYMSKVHLVLCGAHALLSDGGLVGEIGTYTIALVAKAHRVPFCVAAPHFRIHRKSSGVGIAAEVDDDIVVRPFDHQHHRDPADRSDYLHRAEPRYDSTPPALVDLIFTDVGVMTPQAVSQMGAAHMKAFG